MDIANATAGGPSYGILDVIFGTKPEEQPDTDGKGFGDLMNLIKALNKTEKDQEENPLEEGRTDKEISPGAGAVDYRSITLVPGALSGAEILKLNEKVMQSTEGKTLQQGANSGMALMQAMPQIGNAPLAKAQMPLGKIDLNAVNMMLKEKNLPPLSLKEMKLLAEVNQKVDSQNNQMPVGQIGAAISSQGILNKADPEVADEILQKIVNDKQINAKIHSSQVNSELGSELSESIEGKTAAPEKFMNTETYLTMHEEYLPKQATKGGELAENATTSNFNQARANITAMNGKVESKANIKGDLLDKSEKVEKFTDSEKPVQKPMKADSDFGATIMSAQKHDSVGSKDIFLDATKPHTMKTALMGEVVQNINTSALKGGGEMRLVIHPEELGEVKLKVGTKNGKVEVQITAKNEEVASIIRSGSRDLESSLNNQNLQLSKFEVSVSDTTTVLASSNDGKSSLSDQFNNQQGSNHNMSMQSNLNDDRNFSRWSGGGNAWQSSDNLNSENNQRMSSSAQIAPKQVQKYAPRVSSQKIDVVA